MRGQSTSEYAVLVIVALTALLGMQTYLKRGLQARLKVSVEDLLAISDDDAHNCEPGKCGEVTQARGMTSVSADGDLTADFKTTFDSKVVEEFDGTTGGALTVQRVTEAPDGLDVAAEVTVRKGTQVSRQFEPPLPGPTPQQ